MARPARRVRPWPAGPLSGGCGSYAAPVPRSCLSAQAAAGRSACPDLDAVAVGDQAFAMPAHVEQRIPVGTVAGQARDVDRENEAHLAQGHPGHKVLETAAVVARRAARTEIALSITSMSASCQPSARARPCSAYCRRRLS